MYNLKDRIVRINCLRIVNLAKRLPGACSVVGIYAVYFPLSENSAFITPVLRTLFVLSYYTLSSLEYRTLYLYISANFPNPKSSVFRISTCAECVGISQRMHARHPTDRRNGRSYIYRSKRHDCREENLKTGCIAFNFVPRRNLFWLFLTRDSHT